MPSTLVSLSAVGNSRMSRCSVTVNGATPPVKDQQAEPINLCGQGPVVLVAPTVLEALRMVKSILVLEQSVDDIGQRNSACPHAPGIGCSSLETVVNA